MQCLGGAKGEPEKKLHKSKNGTGAAVSSYETYWGQLVTTQEIVDGMKATGFDSLRIPGALSKDECYTTANMINQTFVDTVRSTGGNNKERFLLIPGYNT